MIEKTQKGDDEYHFSELGTSDIYGSEQADDEAQQRFKKLRRILFIFGVIVVVFAGYKLLGVINSKPKQAASSTSVPSISNSVAPTNKTKNFASSSQAVTSTVSPQVDQSIAVLQENEANNKSNLEKLGIDVNELRNTVGDLQKTVATLSDSMQILSNQIEQQATLIENQQTLLTALQPLIPKKKAEANKKRSLKSLYYIDAMVPGRAWIKDSVGRTLTVSMGDKVPGYEGIIVQMDADQGEILMSSGTLIKYHFNDR